MSNRSIQIEQIFSDYLFRTALRRRQLRATATNADESGTVL